MRLSSQSKSLVSLLLPLLLAAPVLAHEVKISGDVGTTFHIEPNDQPKAGVPSKAWFALTHKGGAIIPLSQCNCQLAVYPMPHEEGKTRPLMKPTLSALNVERYKGVPGTIITFPKPGTYELELTGTAKPGANFKPFQFSYQVIVK
jgi:hypothetical protein